jgi:mono/diheme cytochrome c family protein
MPEEDSLFRVVIRKVAIGAILAIVLVILAKALHFPSVFQIMFVLYAMLGTAVFILLDAPSLRPFFGGAAIVALVAFYAVISIVFIAGANVLPQYDPQVEKGKIDKIVKPKLSATEKGKIEELLKRSEDLNAQSQAILKRLEALGGAGAKAIEASVKSAAPTMSRSGSAVGDLVSLGKEQYDLQECYNCHKIGGKGGVKKRGPHLDNIGNLMKPEEMKEKLLNPRSWMAEGFEKEYNKKLMPDKYKELMSDQEVDALVAYLSSLKDSSVETPKPVKKT